MYHGDQFQRTIDCYNTQAKGQHCEAWLNPGLGVESAIESLLRQLSYMADTMAEDFSDSSNRHWRRMLSAFEKLIDSTGSLGRFDASLLVNSARILKAAADGKAVKS